MEEHPSHRLPNLALLIQVIFHWLSIRVSSAWARHIREERACSEIKSVWWWVSAASKQNNRCQVVCCFYLSICYFIPVFTHEILSQDSDQVIKMVVRGNASQVLHSSLRDVVGDSAVSWVQSGNTALKNCPSPVHAQDIVVCCGASH